jgi:hypothetical protein
MGYEHHISQHTVGPALGFSSIHKQHEALGNELAAWQVWSGGQGLFLKTVFQNV